MASLKTHLQYTVVASGVAASAFYSAGVIGSKEAIMCWAFGVLGGVLPDVDSDNAKASSIVFGLFSLMAGAVTLAGTIDQYPLIWSWVASAIVFVAVQFGARSIFAKYSAHRGVFHSLLACIMFVLLVAACAPFFGVSDTVSWFLALFVGFGYVVHLLLDEVFKVNLMDEDYKKPFGGAIKPVDIKSVKATLFMLALTGVLFYFTPDSREFIQLAFSAQTYSEVVGVMF